MLLSVFFFGYFPFTVVVRPMVHCKSSVFFPCSKTCFILCFFPVFSLVLTQNYSISASDIDLLASVRTCLAHTCIKMLKAHFSQTFWKCFLCKCGTCESMHRRVPTTLGMVLLQASYCRMLHMDFGAGQILEREMNGCRDIGVSVHQCAQTHIRKAIYSKIYCFCGCQVMIHVQYVMLSVRR